MRNLLPIALLACLSLQAQKLDSGYTAKIKQYTTEPFFLTELVDHLPASDTVPTPEKTLGYVIGTPKKLTYTKDIYRYMRELEKASPRVKVFSIGRSEEGRETLMVAVSDEANIKKLDRYREINARLADPRKTSDAEAKQLIDEDVPMYWASGSIHSPETGSPEMLMELAYRLAVEDSPLIENIRKHLVVLITPCSEVDGRDREVDVYNYHVANPTKAQPSLVYWGHYVAHDNNRDGLGMALQLSKIMMKTFLDWHPQVLHDLHESVPFLYVSTGMGPYNAWLDPIVVDEWQKMAYVEIEELTKRGVPGVWTHGFYDGWAPNYMFYVANGHNSIGRFYETFGGRGADSGMRTVPAAQTSRTWFRPNPPLPRVNWSIRNNINMQESGILFAMNYTADNRKTFLENFYTKSKRSIEKAAKEGPAAWVIPADDPRPVECADLVNLLKLQGIEVNRSSQETEITTKQGKEEKKVKIPAGSFVIRMDQPYSRMADMLLDTQYYNIADPRPYDDTGWTLGAVRNVKTIRVTDPAILKASMTLIAGPAKVDGQVTGSTSTGAYLIDHNADNTLATFRFRLKDMNMQAAEEPFKAAGKDFHAGSFIIRMQDNQRTTRGRIEQAAVELGLKVTAVDELPKVATHPMAAPRIALVHTWLNTQSEGWYRVAFDNLKIPYEYISDQKLRLIPDLRAKYDVIILGPTPGNSQRVINGLPMRGDPIPWKASAITPNLGNSPDTTDDMRGGMGLEGLLKISKFIDEGGLFVTIAGNDSIPIDYGLIDGVSITTTRELQARGSVLNSVIADKRSPIAYGYGDNLAIYFSQAPVLQVSATGGLGFGGGGGGGQFGDTPAGRPTGRGTPTDPDIPQGRTFVPPPERPQTRPGEEPPMDDEQREALRAFLPSPTERPRIVIRFSEEKTLLISGMLAGGRELANRPAVVDVPRGKGHVLLFANNPVWRNETQGSYFLLFNALLNYDHLSAGAGAAQPARPNRSGPTANVVE
ncbi:MAG TPA: M14 family zinc carboxypeptidase [Bryobacteraceae bacterium]|nr:M14 family zinc carboxypeptidase [Bryobacteraceae bacterium]